jgi:hypothetical protein
LEASLASSAEGTLAQDEISGSFVSKVSANLTKALTGHCSRRNVVNIFLYVAERSRYYYPASDIPEMLETFVPLVTQDVCGHSLAASVL